MPLIEVRTQEKEHIRHGGGFLMQNLLTSAFIYLPVIDPSSSWEGQGGTGAGVRDSSLWEGQGGTGAGVRESMAQQIW